MEIKEIDKNVAIDFVQKYHYSKILPRLTKYYLGFFEKEELGGVIMLGWGTQPLQTIKKIFYKDNLETKDYLEIGKMCFLPKFNKNSYFGSKVCSLLIKWMKKNTNCLFLYTLADGIRENVDTSIKQAVSNILGNLKQAFIWIKKTGEKIHPRSAKKLCEENARFLKKEKVFWLTDDFCKYKGIDKINGLMFRYIFPLNKKAKKILSKYDFSEKNPKDKDLIFEKRIEKGKFIKIEQPLFNMDFFKYNYQKYN